MDREKDNELQRFRTTFIGRLKNIASILCFFVGLYFWFFGRKLWLAIPIAVLAPLFLNIPGYIYGRVAWLREEYNPNLMKVYEFCLLLVVVYSVAGSAYLFYLPYQFDILVHYTENFVFAFLFILGLNVYRSRQGRSGYSAKRAAGLILLAGVALSVSWEIYQTSCDRLFKTKMAFDSFQTWLSDSTSDMVGGILGLAVFTPLIVLPFWDHLLSVIRRQKRD